MYIRTHIHVYVYIHVCCVRAVCVCMCVHACVCEIEISLNTCRNTLDFMCDLELFSKIRSHMLIAMYIAGILAENSQLCMYKQQLITLHNKIHGKDTVGSGDFTYFPCTKR